MTQLPEGRAPIDREDLAKLAGHPSTWQAEIKSLKDKLAKAEARKPVVKPLPWVESEGRAFQYKAWLLSAKAQAWLGAHYLIKQWPSGKFEACAGYPGRQGQEIGDGIFETLDQAKAACQADYARFILDAIEWEKSE